MYKAVVKIATSAVMMALKVDCFAKYGSALLEPVVN